MGEGWNKMDFEEMEPAGIRYHDYHTIHLYIVDDLHPDVPLRLVDGQVQKSAHQDKCDRMRDFFNLHVAKSVVHRIHPPENTTKDQWLDYWRNEFGSKTRSELLIIYYHGLAGWQDADYSWNFEDTQIAIDQANPQGYVNAYSVLNMATKSLPDCLFLLDCWVQTRFKGQLKNRMGCTEIIARPEPIPDPSGRVIEDHPADFTTTLLRNLGQIPRADGKVERLDQVFTIPEFMKHDTHLHSSLPRVWCSRTRYQDTRFVGRVKIDREKSIAAGKVVFVWEKIQCEGPILHNKPVQNEINLALQARGVEKAVAPHGDVHAETVDEAVDVEMDDNGSEDGGGLFVQ